MELSNILESVTGKRWVLRSKVPLEFSPLHDTRPFPREMISVTPNSPQLSIEEAVTALAGSMEPMMWAGTLQCRLVEGIADCAVIDVTGNPLTGPLLLVLRIVRLEDEAIWFIHEVRGELQPQELESIVYAIAHIDQPDLVARETSDQGADEDCERPPLAALLQVLGDHPVGKRIESALNEPEVIKQFALLSVNIADILRAPAFVEALSPEAFTDVVRALQGITQVFINTRSEAAATYGASLLARGVLLHAVSNETELQRAQELSALLVDRAGSAFPARREEALLTNLFARAALAVKNGNEDYGDLTELARIFSADEPLAYRVITRLVNDATFLKGFREQEYSAVRLARCDIALATLQRMSAAPGALRRGIERADPHARQKDDDQGSVLLSLYESLPPEFELEPGAVSNRETPALLPTLQATMTLAIWELERYYGIDLDAAHAAVLKYLEGRQRPDLPSLLFLRGFRSSKRLWVENNFTFEQEEIIPFPKEPPRLSIEAALTKGLGVRFLPMALGGLSDPLGMGRVLSVLTIDAWKGVFDTLAESAAIILVLPDDSDALTWELTQLSERRYLHRVALLMAPLALDRKASAIWNHTARFVGTRQWMMPDYDERGAFVLFSKDGAVREQHPFATLFDGSLAVRLSEIFPGPASA
jgi:hypothetical protein